MLTQILNPKRAVLPRDAIAELNCSASINSLIGRKNFSSSQSTARITELNGLEDDKGFVYFAEKQWLLDRVEGPHELSYEDWVFHVFEGVSASTKDYRSGRYISILFDGGLFFPSGKKHRLRLREPFRINFLVDEEIEKAEPYWFVIAFHRLFYFYNYIEQALDAGLRNEIDIWYKEDLAQVTDPSDEVYEIVVERIELDVSEDFEHWDITFGTCYADACMHAAFQGDKAIGMKFGIGSRREDRQMNKNKGAGKQKR